MGLGLVRFRISVNVSIEVRVRVRVRIRFWLEPSTRLDPCFLSSALQLAHHLNLENKLHLPCKREQNVQRFFRQVS